MRSRLKPVRRIALMIFFLLAITPASAAEPGPIIMSPTLRIGGPSYTLAFGRALAGVLCYLAARKQPVVHSDIKPGSILVGDDLARPTLVDFGSSVWLPASGPGLIPHSAFGTPGYAVPEQYPLSPADRR